MRQAHRFIVAAVLFAPVAVAAMLAPVTTRAQNPIMTIVIGHDVSVREKPYADSPVLATLDESEVVFVTDAAQGWVKIEYEAAAREWKSGWIERSAVRLERVSAAASGPAYTKGRVDTFENGFGAAFHLNLDNVDLDCRRDAEAGYNNCDIVVETSMETNYNGAREPQMRFRCDALLQTTDSENAVAGQTVFGYGDVIGRAGAGRLTMNFNIYSTLPVRRVRVENLACLIENVQE